ncbi:MAG: DUF3301 domain-containing protein [Hahellaceae bacterium]|nr:DUF3301 domain-containing protein [Hahellaceae bacterium]MCP5209862.1 DUF3301 domain-containing protein [Hahellaceae bacterium]
MLELSDLFIIAVLAASAAYWWKAREIKERALFSVKQYCEKNTVEFLDESLVLTGIGFSKNVRKQWKLRRTYRFEFSSTGEYRYYGTITMLGKQTSSIELAPHHV